MKKYLALLLACVLVLCCLTVVHAETAQVKRGGILTVNFRV